MSRIGLAILALSVGITAYAQTPAGRYDNFTLGSNGRPAAFATVRVCAWSATPASPCTPLSNIYTNFGLTSAQQNPFTADALGNFGFNIAPGRYTVQLTATLLAVHNLAIVVPCDPTICGTGGGGGGVAPGICQSQVVTAVNLGGPTCTTVSSAYVDTSIALTGGDVNTSSQVVSTHITGGTVNKVVKFNATGNLVPGLLGDSGTVISLAAPFDFTKQSAPANPSAGSIRLYADSSSGNLTCLTSAGANCIPTGGGGGTPGGTNTAVQFNTAGVFAGDSANFNYNSTSHAVTTTGDSIAARFIGSLVTVTPSTTPVFNGATLFNSLTLGQSVTSSTITGASNNQLFGVNICQNGTGNFNFSNSYPATSWPASFPQGPVVPLSPSTCLNAIFWNNAGSMTLIAEPHTGAAAIRYVARNGADTNDGLTLATAFATVGAAYDSLPSTTGVGGVINIDASTLTNGGGVCMNGAANNCTTGLWVCGAEDSACTGTLPAGWRAMKAGGVKLIGIGQASAPSNSPGGGLATVYGCSTTDKTKPVLWLDGLSQPFSVENIDFGHNQCAQPVKLAISMAGARDANTGFSVVNFKNVAASPNRNSVTNGPGIDIGSNGIWLWMEKITCDANTTAAVGSDFRACIVSDPGAAAASGPLYLRDSTFNGAGGVIAYTGGNALSVFADHVMIESDGNIPCAPVVWMKNTNQFAYGNVRNLQLADCPVSTTYPAFFNDGSAPASNMLVQFAIGVNGLNVSGKAQVLNTSYRLSASTPEALGQQAWWDDTNSDGTVGRISGTQDSARRGFGPVAVTKVNLANTLPASWTIINGTVTTGITAPDGTTNAATISNSGGCDVRPYQNASFSTAAGGWVIGGVWARAVTSWTTGMQLISVGMQGGTFTNGQTVIRGNAPVVGDGEWEWIHTSSKVVTGQTNNVFSLSLSCDGSHQVRYYGPVLQYYAPGTISDNEAAYVAEHFQSYSNTASVKDVTTLPGTRFSIGVPNSNFFLKIADQPLTADRIWTIADIAGIPLVYTGTAPANNDCLKAVVTGSTISATGAGGACSGGGGTPGGSTTQVQFNNAGSFGGSADLTWVSPALTIGVAGSTTGQLKLTGSSSGTVSILGQAAAGTYNFNLPVAAGSSGQPLLSGGGGATAMSFGTLGIAAGGTGQVTAGAAFNALAPATALGGLIVGSGANTYTNLARGTNGQCLVISGTSVVWGACTGSSGVTSVGLGVPTGFPISGTNPVTTTGTFTWAMPTGWTTGSLLLGNGANSAASLAIGANGLCLVSNGSTAAWTTCPGGGGTPGGSNTQVQYNNAGAFGGSSNFTWNNASSLLTVGGNLAIKGPSPWIDVTAPPYNADATGVSTSGTAFTNAFAAAATNGGAIYIPCGTYDVNAAIVSTVGSLQVVGQGNSGVHNATTANQCVIWQVDGAGLVGLSFSSASTYYAGPRISNINFTAKNGTEAGGLLVEASNSIIDSVNFDNFSGVKIAVPAAITISLAAGGSIAASTVVNVKTTWETIRGETAASATSNQVTTAGTCTGSGNCRITVPQAASPPAGATFWDVYVLASGGTSTSGNYIWQARIALATGSTTLSTITTTGVQPPAADESGAFGLKITGTINGSNSFNYQSRLQNIRTYSNNYYGIIVGRNAVATTIDGGDLMATNTVLVANSPVYVQAGTHFEGGAAAIGASISGSGGQISAAMDGMATGISCVSCTNWNISPSLNTLTTSGITLDSGSLHNFVFLNNNSRTLTLPVVDNGGSNQISITGDTVANTLSGSATATDAIYSTKDGEVQVPGAGILVPGTANTVDIGTSSLYFRNLYIASLNIRPIGPLIFGGLESNSCGTPTTGQDFFYMGDQTSHSGQVSENGDSCRSITLWKTTTPTSLGLVFASSSVAPSGTVYHVDAGTGIKVDSTGSTIATYNGTATAGNGISPILYSNDLAARATSIGSTTMFTTPASGAFSTGVFVLYADIVCTTGEAGSTVGLTVGWNNGSAALTSVLIPNGSVCNTTGNEYTSIPFTFYSGASQAITFLTTAASFSTGRYVTHVRLEAK